MSMDVAEALAVEAAMGKSGGNPSLCRTFLDEGLKAAADEHSQEWVPLGFLRFCGQVVNGPAPGTTPMKTKRPTQGTVPVTSVITKPSPAALGPGECP